MYRKQLTLPQIQNITARFILKTIETSCMHVSPFRPCQKNLIIIAIILPGRDCIDLLIVDVRSSTYSFKATANKKEIYTISSYLDVAVLNRFFNTLFMKVWSFTTSIGQIAQIQTTDSTADPQYPQGHTCPLSAWLLSGSCSRESKDGPAQCSVSESVQFVSRWHLKVLDWRPSCQRNWSVSCEAADTNHCSAVAHQTGPPSYMLDSVG